MPRNYRHALIAMMLAPTLLGASCDPVDLGGSPDAGASPMGDAGTPSTGDAGSPMTDAAAATDAGAFVGDASTYARSMLIDVFDETESTLSFELEVEVDDPTSTAHVVRPQRLELLDGSGGVVLTYPLDPSPIDLTRSEPTGQQYRSFEISAVGAVAPALVTACADDAFSSRLLTNPIRVVVEVDGRTVSREQRVPAGTGGFTPLRPFVLCHRGVQIERAYEGFHNGFLGFTLRPDGLYDAEIWESAGGAIYASPPVRSIDSDVRISPMNGRHFPSVFPPFSAAMSAQPCAGCTLDVAMFRWIMASATPPLRVPSAMNPYWCAEPAPGQDDGIPWHPTTPGVGNWSCYNESGPIVSGDGAGFVRFSGTTDTGPFGVELFVPGGNWYFDETHLP